MEIVSIFARKLFAFRYKNETDNELKRLLDLWNDVGYLYNFVGQNKKDITNGKSVEAVVNQIIYNANEIDDTLNECSKGGRSLDEFFKPLDNNEFRVVTLSKQKGRKNYLRIYALKIDTDFYVITGGAIKFTHLMNDRPHTKEELSKIAKCQSYLKENGVSDIDSFFELLNETQ